MALKRMENGHGIEVRNADILVLQRAAYAMQDICALEEQLKWQEDRRFFAAQRFGQSRSGGSKAGLEAGLAAMDETKRRYEERLAECKEELKAAEKIIGGIRNANMRTFVVMVYVMMLAGREVRMRLNMSEYAFRQAREAIEQAESMEAAQWPEKYVMKKEI